MPTGKADWAGMLPLASYVSEEVAPEVSQQLQQLQGALDTLAPQWKSSASAAFYSVNERWQEDAAKLNKALMDIAEGLRASAAAYQRMTQDSADTVGQIKA